jgi:AraC-like DNA-binding protein
MTYREIAPGERLKPYVKCFYIFESELKTEFEDIVFPVGQMEIVFNLGDGIWKSLIDKVFQATPQIEVWGQITQPLNVKSIGNHTMLGIRFYTHTPGCFLNEDVCEFNNQVSDLTDVLGTPVKNLHLQLRETQVLYKRIELIETFLIKRLALLERKTRKIDLLGRIVKDMQANRFSENINSIALRYDLTPRFLQTLFVRHTGVAPKLFSKINRFQASLRHIAKKEASLTSIAYDCGYFDQAHLIRDFKSFTGLTPSAYSLDSSPVSSALFSS